jgi:hypothetical protein
MVVPKAVAGIRCQLGDIMRKKILILLLTLIGGALYALSRYISISHWAAIDFNMVSYNPFLPLLSWASWIIYMYITWLKRPGYYYWFIGILWFVANLYFTYGILVTWWI